MSFSRHKARLLKDVGITPEALGGDYHDYAAISEHPELKQWLESLVDDHLEVLGYDTKNLQFAYHDRRFMEAMHHLLSASNRLAEGEWAHYLQGERVNLYAEHSPDHQPSADSLVKHYTSLCASNFFGMVMEALGNQPTEQHYENKDQALVGAKQAVEAAATIADLCKLPLRKRRADEEKTPIASRLKARLEDPTVMQVIAQYQTHAPDGGLTRCM